MKIPCWNSVSSQRQPTLVSTPLVSSRHQLKSSIVEPIFEALSICAALHPDELPADSDSDDDAFVDPDISAKFEVFDGTEEQELSEVGKVRSDVVNDNRYVPY